MTGFVYNGAGGSGYVSALTGGNMTPALPGSGLVDGLTLMVLHTGAFSTSLTAPNLTSQGWTKLTTNATAPCVAAYGKVYATGDAAPNVQWGTFTGSCYSRIFSWNGDVYPDLSTIVVAFNERATNATGKIAVNATTATGVPANALYLRFGHCAKTSLNNGSTFSDWLNDSGIYTKAGELIQNGSTLGVGFWYASQAVASATSSDVAALTTADTNANTQGITLVLQPKTTTPIAAAASAGATASATLGNSGAISGGGSASATAAAQLTTAIRMAVAASAGTVLAGGLTNWTTVTLTGVQYTGVGGIHDPNFWGAGVDPPIGTTLSYDATNATIYSNGEISSITNNCSFVVQWFDAANNVERLGVVVITPQMVSYASVASAAAATLSTAIKLSGGAISIASSTGNLTAAVRLAGTALAVANAAAALITAVQLNGVALAGTSATGGLTGGQSSLQGNAQALTTVIGALTAKIQLASAVSVSSVLAGALSSRIVFSSAANTLAQATGDLSTAVRLAGTANVVSTAAGAALITTAFAGAANAVSSALGAIQTGIQLAGLALSDAEGSGDLGTGISLSGAAEVDTVASIRPVGAEGQFGYADINLLSPTGLPVVLAVYIAGTTFIATITYFNSKGLPFVPLRVQYRIDDVNSGLNLLPYTDIEDVELSNAITIPGADNTMINNTRNSEQHQLLFRITDGLSQISYVRAVFEVVSTTGIN